MKGQGCLNCWWGFRRYDYAITELEKVKAEIQDLDLGFVDEEYQAGVAYGIMKFNQILDKHIAELKKGE